MSLRKGFVRFVVVTAPFVFFSAATQTRTQSQDENANATAPLYKTASIKPSKSGIHANHLVKLGPDELTATNASPQAILEHAYDVQDDQIVGAPSWLNSKE